MRQSLTALACGFALFLSLPACAAESLDWNEPVTKFAEFIAELSASRYEEAWQIYRVMLPETPKQPATPFEPDPFESFKAAAGRFPANIESFQQIASRNYSDRSRRMYFIADTDYGPYLVELMVYRAREQWFFIHFGYQSIAMSDINWHKQYEDLLPMTRLPAPITIPLPKRDPAAETAEK